MHRWINSFTENTAVRVQRRWPWILLLFVLATGGLCPGGIVLAQPTPPAATNPDNSAQLQQFEQELSAIEQRLSRQRIDLETLNSLREQLQASHSQLLAIRDQSQTELDKFNELLAALGTKPKPDEPPEAPAVAAQRSELEAQRDPILGQAKKADVLLIKTEEFLDTLATLATGLQNQAFFYRRPAIWQATVWQQAYTELSRLLTRLRAALTANWNESGPYLVLLTLPILVFLAVRWFLQGLPWLRGERDLQRYFSRAGRGGIRLFFFTLLPALIVAACVWLLLQLFAIGQTGATVSTIGAAALFSLIFVADLSRTVLRPWRGHQRLLHIYAPYAIASHRYLRIAALLFGASVLVYGLGEQFARQDALLQLSQLLLRALLALFITLAVTKLLRALRSGVDETGEKHLFAQRRRAFKRLLIALLLLAVVVASVINPLLIAFGFVNMADQLFNGVFGTALLIVGLWFAHHVAAGTLEWLLHRLLRPLMIIYLRRRYTRRLGRLIHIFALALFDLILLVALFIGLAWLWHLDLTRFSVWLKRIWAGVEIGSLRFSFLNILAGLVVLIAALLITRLVQRLLARRVLPYTRWDKGMQTTLLSGIGSLGLLIAIILAVATLGVAIAELALILGGLAIGVGFGLQHLVNNVVSGIVLMLERPVKPGDWVIINEREGVVAHIGLRATEIKTLSLASVLVPNSEIISATVTNWSFRDPEVAVTIVLTVPATAEDDIVSHILAGCARAHPLVLTEPGPEVLLRAFSELGLEYELSVYIRHIDQQWQVASELRKAIVKRFRAAGVELATYSGLLPARAAVHPTKRVRT